MPLSSLYSALLEDFSETALILFFKQEATVSGRNVYGILRAGRSLGTESIILSAPLLEEGRNRHGITVMLALAEYFQSKSLKHCIPPLLLLSEMQHSQLHQYY